MKINTELFKKELTPLASAFSSRNDFLDQFLKSDEAFDDGIGKTFVWVNEKRTKINV